MRKYKVLYDSIRNAVHRQLTICCIILYLSYNIILCIKTNIYFIFFHIIILVFAIPFVVNDSWGHSENIFIGKIFTIVKEYNKNNKNLKDYYSNPTLITEKILPQNIVVIIGESFSRDFSSLYGYDKLTNPYLSQLPDSSLIIFNNVYSRDVQTIENIEYIMSTFKYNSKRKWYECLTLNEILTKLHYRTYWVSNQSKVGLWDNIPTKYAYLCDSVTFVGPQNDFNSYVSFDENVISPIKYIMNNDSSQKVLFVHLIGSHPNFKQRYPQNRIKFSVLDYKRYAENQRLVRAHYDNSLVYNDSVVNEIFKLGNDKEAIFFYFSDHGLDIFETNSNYAGHGRRGIPNSEEIAKKIPFMIYTSHLYRKRYPNEMNMMFENVNNKFVTENFIYTLMDLLGVKFEQNDDVVKYSLFRN